MENQKVSSNFYMLTAQVLNDKNLNHAEKITMAILNGLADENGKCWPSNDWLAEKLSLKERAVQDIVAKLEKLKYIRREIISCSKDPFKKYRLIFVCNNFKLCLPGAENCTIENAENCTIDMQKTACIIDKKESLIDKKECRPSACSHPEAGNVSILLLEAIKKTKPDIKEPTFHSVHQEMDRMLRIDERKIETVRKLIAWLPTHEFWSKNILSAEKFRKQFDRLELEMTKKPKETASDDLELIKRLEEHFGKAPPSKVVKVVIGRDYVDFVTLRDSCFKIGEASFKEKVLNSLRKIGVPVK